MAAMVSSATRFTCDDAPGATSSSACSRCATVVLIPGGSMLRSSPILLVSIAAACSSQSTARRGLQTQTAKSSGNRQFGVQAQQRLAHDAGEERTGRLVGPARADDDGGQPQRDGIEEAAAGGIRQDQLGRGLLRAIAVAGDLARVVRQDVNSGRR